MARALSHPEHKHPPRLDEGAAEEAQSPEAAAVGGASSPESAAVELGLDINPDGSLKVDVGEDTEFRVTPTSVEYVPTTDEHMVIAQVRRWIRDPLQPLRGEL